MKKIWNDEELGQHWSLTYEELELLKTKPEKNHLAFCMQLKYYQYYGAFPENKKELSEITVQYISEQLEIDIDTLFYYDWENRTARRHKQEILIFLKIRKLDSKDRINIINWLITEIFPKGILVSEAFEYAIEWLLQNKIQSPAVYQLERMIASAYSKFRTTLFENISKSLSNNSKAIIDYCIEDENSPINFTYLKSDPGRVSLESILKELEKLEFIDQLELPEQQLSALNSKVMNLIRSRAFSETSWELKRHPPIIRYALMSVFFYTRRSEIIDGLIELLVQIIHRLSVKAEKKVIKVLMKDFKKVYGKNTLLGRIAEASLNNPDSIVKEVVYPIVGVQTLNNLVREYKSSGKDYQKEVHKVIRSSYSSHYRRMVPKILNGIKFCSNNMMHQPVLEALRWLESHKDSNQQYHSLSDNIPINGVVRSKYYDIIIEIGDKGEKKINRINYEICVLQVLREKLRCKEIWVEGADKYRNPDQDLPQDFSENRTFYYQDLGITQDAQEFINNIKENMSKALSSLNISIPNNKQVRLLARHKNHISLSPLAEQPEPININRLKGQIQTIWPMTSLLDILKEADLRIGFTECFKTQRSSERLSREELQKRLLLSLYGLGTNTGLKRISASRHGVGYKELLLVRKSYIYRTALREAIGKIANAIFKIRNPDIWGEGTTTCASDSKKFGSWDQNLMTEWHIRYGGRGVMIYWHVERKSTCIYSQLKRCSSSEVASMIEGVLRHCTEMSIDKQYVDTHGQSEVAFAFSYLLGFNLMPRLKNISKQKLYVPDSGTSGDCQNIKPILTRVINWDLIAQQYDQMVQYTTALKQGTADPEAILRRFTKGNITHPTYKALSELGKAIKTIFLCQYLEKEELRREIHEGLNVVENWNSANSFIFFGKGGEVATNRLEDQELSVLSLHLVQICLVYINTLMIQQITSAKEWKNVLTTEDYRALSPLIYAHVNPYGVFELNMKKRLSILA
ncbi:Tn3 family transposase [Elizabethkingia sp. M8]|uniref:Tn3 family transposase n=1 Tax=Elizabethkingia sp. M8 TaxID=2796140 RepID=UPI0019089509|nr:Tn3 family transposase [Elizabethkingia sp. M8]QQM26557.1 Tn3 family transposase [Elizabethkingia sp. M8]